MPGNDDYGETSSWAVWAYLGLYPLPPTTDYAIVTPVFDDVTLSLPAATSAASAAAAASPWTVGAGGALLRIRCYNRTAGARQNYVLRASVNGVALPRAVVTHEALLGTGRQTSLLELWLSPTPVTFQPGAGDGDRDATPPFVPPPRPAADAAAVLAKALAACGPACDVAGRNASGDRDATAAALAALPPRRRRTSRRL